MFNPSKIAGVSGHSNRYQLENVKLGTASRKEGVVVDVDGALTTMSAWRIVQTSHARVV